MRPYNRYSSKPLLVKIVTRIALTQRTHDRASLHVATRHEVHISRHTSLWILAVVLVTIPACHIVFDIVCYIVSLSTIPNNAIIVP